NQLRKELRHFKGTPHQVTKKVQEPYELVQQLRKLTLQHPLPMMVLAFAYGFMEMRVSNRADC
ncbi:MAG: hypothetical protein KDD62_11840, partial [Bdellovibrionales bacterium]|nr:hypothetical protein [Bdellovibrionales bacterium]